ncbi:hypothetical protein ACB092_11G072900 [Castanea dentata]
MLLQNGVLFLDMEDVPLWFIAAWWNYYFEHWNLNGTGIDRMAFSQANITRDNT